MTAFASLARRIGSHAAVYATLPVFTFATGLANVVVLTRFLDPSEYGRLGVLLVFSSLLTIAFNLGSLQGTFRVGFGASGDEGEEADDLRSLSDAKRREAIGTGIAITLLTASVGTIVVVGLGGPIARLIDPSVSTWAYVWAAAGGGLGAVWRLVSNLLRLERRPLAYVFVHASRPILGLAASLPLVAAGQGIAGALAGYALGTAASVVLGLVLTRSGVRAGFSLSAVRSIYEQGSPLVPITLGFWTMENADVFLLAGLATAHDVGLYRVSARLGAVVAYATSAYMMASGPFMREPIFIAAERERGRARLMAALNTHLVIAAVGATLVLAIYAHDLVRIADTSYHDAAPLIPLLGVRWATKTLFQAFYRSAAFATKQRVFIFSTLASSGTFLVLAVLLIPMWGAYGAATAAAISPLLGAVAMRWRARVHGEDSPLESMRVIGVVLIAGACWAVAQLAGDVTPRFLTDTACVAAFPVLIIATGVVPWTQVRMLADSLRSRRDELTPELHPTDAAILTGIVDGGVSVPELATRVGITVTELHQRLATTLRLLTSRSTKSEPSPHDEALGAYLAWGGSQAERDFRARQLWASGVDPLEIDALQQTLTTLRRRARRTGKGREGVQQAASSPR